MKRAILLAVLALVCGLTLGLLIGSGRLSPTQAQATSLSAIATADLSRANRYYSPPAEENPLDPTDDQQLLDRAGQVLEALKEQDYAALSSLVHPIRGVTFTPYSTVDLSCNLTLDQRQIAGLGQDETIYLWGVFDGSGKPIQATGSQYFQRYVFNADYTAAPTMAVDQVTISGNALENVAAAYPDGRFVEYHFPGLDPEKNGFDWCSLKLVFEIWENQWYLVGLIHGEWTV
ncbi:hypothetical protein [Pseudoflavonifractor phocaeensis]|uniref:hypothetical protein n=1 Tax=Pseudoflavonifractor phocaeensis TaxID=1870988 RepID=UPI00195C90EC|nr:hypothetical protein [Pseudoflavonifractor phocaeensis]MBM6926753.1 hypothetical protein [Pseudoflavonifractor phocaeensis]